MKYYIFIINIFIFCIFQNNILFANDIVNRDGINSISLGDNINKIYSEFNKVYKIMHNKTGHEVLLLDNGQKIIKFYLNEDDDIYQIDIFKKYKTSKGIKVGSSLGEVKAKYGKPFIDPTDEGYFIFFDEFPGVMFKLEDDDIPEKLKHIPDDALTEDMENKILKIKSIRIKSIRLYLSL